MQIEEADPGKGTKQNQKCMGSQDKRRQAFREERVGPTRSHSAEVFEEDRSALWELTGDGGRQVLAELLRMKHTAATGLHGFGSAAGKFLLCLPEKSCYFHLVPTLLHEGMLSNMSPFLMCRNSSSGLCLDARTA